MWCVVERLDAALQRGDDPVKFNATLPRDTAAKLLTLLTEERLGGARVVRANTEFRTSQAATILGVSRPHLSRLINEGRIEARKVGAHWRIPAMALERFQTAEDAERVARVDAFATAQNEAGLFA